MNIPTQLIILKDLKVMIIFMLAKARTLFMVMLVMTLFMAMDLTRNYMETMEMMSSSQDKTIT